MFNSMFIITNTKLGQGEDRLTQTLVFSKFSCIYIQKYMVPPLNGLKNILKGSAVTALSLCQRQRL